MPRPAPAAAPAGVGRARAGDRRRAVLGRAPPPSVLPECVAGARLKPNEPEKARFFNELASSGGAPGRRIHRRALIGLPASRGRP